MQKTILVFLVLFMGFNASARKRLRFGLDQNIVTIEPALQVPVIDEEGDFLANDFGDTLMGELAYMTEVRNFLAPVWLKDKGYVVKIAAESYISDSATGEVSIGEESYYPLNEISKKVLAEYLGGTIPSYSISIWDYVFGYLLWFILGGIVIYNLIKRKFFPSKEEEEEAPEAS